MREGLECAVDWIQADCMAVDVTKSEARYKYC